MPPGLSARSHTAPFDEFIYSGKVTLPEESNQLRLYRHPAPTPRATLLTLTSSSTLDRSRYLRSQISSGYIATRLHCHSASAPGATLLTSTSFSSQSTWTSSILLFIMTSSSHQPTWTSSYSTIYIDELFQSVNTDELHSTIHHDEFVPSANMDELQLNNLH